MSQQPVGCFNIMLHAHLPYVLGHGTWPHGSQMLFDCATDTYIPLLWTFRKLVSEGISPNVTISFSAVLLEQFNDDRFKEWFPGHLGEKIYYASENEREFGSRGEGHLAWLAKCMRERFEALRNTFEEANRDLIGAYRELHEAGHIEVITCPATHGYLPLLREDGSVQLQVKQAVSTFNRLMGAWPRGMWLPECAYRPHANWAPRLHLEPPQTPWPRKGVEEFLADNGVDFFFVDTHFLSGHVGAAQADREDTLGKLWGQMHTIGEPGAYHGSHTPYAPYFAASGAPDLPAIAVVVRDPATSLQVWSATHGYPGDVDYLEFHKKHQPGDIRYWRISDSRGDLGAKDAYHPEWAEWKARQHAGNFLWCVKETLKYAPREDRQPILCAPFDAELFGHWWFEGPYWLEHVLRWMHYDPEIELATCGKYLNQYPPSAAIHLPEASWGAGGGHWVWMNEKTDWTWEKVYDAEKDYKVLLADHGTGHDDASRALITQAGRELLLLEASDWQFLITTGSAADYAGLRLGSHYSDYKKIADTARRYCRGEVISSEEWDHLGGCQDRDRLFPDLDPAWFRDIDRPAT